MKAIYTSQDINKMAPRALILKFILKQQKLTK